jgi:hypothetical protein
VTDSRYVTVCSECLCASCWQGVFLCHKSGAAGTMDLDVRYLAARALESPEWWGDPIEVDQLVRRTLGAGRG